MIKEKEFFWFLQIDKSLNMNFCVKYKDRKPLSVKKNEKILEKLKKQGVKKISFIGEEALNYKDFSHLLIHAKYLGFETELIFRDLFFYYSSEFDFILESIDFVTLCLPSTDDSINLKLGKSKNYFKQIYELIEYILLSGVRVNILTMVNKENLFKQEEIVKAIGVFGINKWEVLNYMPILLDKSVSDKDIGISKNNFKFNYNLHSIIRTKIKHLIRLDTYRISRCFRIILPNGDLAAINEKDSILIGNILNDEEEVIEKNFKNRKKHIISRIKDEKVRVYIANENKDVNNDIVDEIASINYVEIVGISQNGKKALEEIINTKPDIIFSQYDFKDISGEEFFRKIAKSLDIDCPGIYLFTNNLNKTIFKDNIGNLRYKLNCWIGDNSDYNKERFSELVKEFKVYRDKE